MTKSAYPIVKALLTDRLAARAGLFDVNVTYAGPTTAEGLRTTSGTSENIWFEDADGDCDVIVFTGGALRFDEQLRLVCIVQVLGTTTADTQRAVDDRATEIVAEVLGELALDPTLGAHDPTPSAAAEFDYFTVTPLRQRWTVGALTSGGGHGARCELELDVMARRTY